MVAVAMHCNLRPPHPSSRQDPISDIHWHGASSSEIQHFFWPRFSGERREIVTTFLEMRTKFQQIFEGNGKFIGDY